MITTFDQKLAEYLNNWVVGGWPVGNLLLVVIALVLSVVLCGVIGIEREWKGRSAGLRTHLLVGIGSCMIMIISIYGFPALFAERRDVARLAAQIITGVGFLGAGAIMHRNSGIKGLTTAGTIWIVMAIGIACGSFNFILATAGTIIILLVLTVFRSVELRINKKNPVIQLRAAEGDSTLEKVLNVSKAFGCEINIFSTDLSVGEDGKSIMEMTFQVVFASKEPKVMEYISELEKQTNAISVQLLSRR